MAVAAGVPLRVAVPAVPALKVTPEGSAPDSDSVGVGVPVAVTVNVPAVPAVNVVDAALVITCDPLITVRVNGWVVVPAVLVAVRIRGNVPSPAELNVPASVAVPVPVPAVKVTPAGRVPDSDSVGVGVPVAVTVNDAGWPTVNVVDVKEVNSGTDVTVSVNACVVLPAELVAEMVKL